GVQGDSAVLRLTPLGDVKARKHLEAGRDPGGQTLGHTVRDMQYAVDAIADDELVLLRLDMDVAGSIFSGRDAHRVDQADKRAVGNAVIGFEVVLVRLPLDGGGFVGK